MRTADTIREHVIRAHIMPARARGDSTVTIIAGDIHSEMNLKRRLPAVCCALGSVKFEELAEVERMSLEGPILGSSTTFTFKL